MNTSCLLHKLLPVNCNRMILKCAISTYSVICC